MSSLTPPADLQRSPSTGTAAGTAFVVGQNVDGQWLAVETRGRGGGLFRSKTDALHYVAFETGTKMDDIPVAPLPITLTL